MVDADVISSNHLSPTFFGNQELGKDAIGIEDIDIDDTTVSEVKKTPNFVSQSAVALRCRVMPPPCFKNPYVKDASQMEIDPFGNQRSKCAGIPLSDFIEVLFSMINRKTLLETCYFIFNG